MEQVLPTIRMLCSIFNHQFWHIIFHIVQFHYEIKSGLQVVPVFSVNNYRLFSLVGTGLAFPVGLIEQCEGVESDFYDLLFHSCFLFFISLFSLLIISYFYLISGTEVARFIHPVQLKNNNMYYIRKCSVILDKNNSHNHLMFLMPEQRKFWSWNHNTYISDICLFKTINLRSWVPHYVSLWLDDVINFYTSDSSFKSPPPPPSH